MITSIIINHATIVRPVCMLNQGRSDGDGYRYLYPPPKKKKLIPPKQISGDAPVLNYCLEWDR